MKLRGILDWILVGIGIAILIIAIIALIK